MIDAGNVNILIKEGEGLTVEFKEHFTPRIDEDIVAFANTKGGVILLGVRDDRTVSGEKLINDLKARINSVARNCNPPIQVKIKQLHNIIAIEVPQGEEKPYSCSPGYFRRLDGTTQKMTNHELRTMFQEHEKISFEEKTNRGVSWKDISREKIRNFLKEADIGIKKIIPQDILTSLSLVQKGRITNAGALMFASKVEKFIPHAESIFASFKGTDKTNIYDRNDVKDDLLIQFSEAVAFLKKHLNVRSEIRGVDRFDIYEIPLDALREAVVNAIVHRNYAIKGTSIYVRIYDDRVEIENPGGLPAGITRRDFAKSSVRRNPIIADLFHRMGKVERMGSGIDRMRNLMRDAGLKEPMFEMDDFFRVTFYRDPRYSLKADRATGEKGLGEKLGERLVEKGAEDTTQKTTYKTTRKKAEEKAGEGSVKRLADGLADGLVERLAESQKRILELTKENPYISKNELSKKIGISTTAIDKNITKLKKEGLLKRIGPDKGGHWEIVKS